MEADRFWSKVEIGDPKHCWNWVGCLIRGRGRFMYAGNAEFAHRVSWALTHGSWPQGMLVCHKCDNPSCVNPDHLFLGTQTDNMLDMMRKKRHPCIQKTCCPKGHPYEGDNLGFYLNPKTTRAQRYCMQCKRDKANARWERIRNEDHN